MTLLLPRVIGLLSSPAFRRINFRLGVYTVMGNDYAALAQAIFNGRIAFSIDPVKLSKLQAGAAYIERTLVVASESFGTTLVEQMILTHECTHAINDMKGFVWSSTFSDDEAVAYLAGALYCYRATGSLQRELEPDPFFATTQKPFKTAFDIARKAKWDGELLVVSAADAISLRTKIVSDPTYQAMGVTLGTLPTHGNW